MLFVINQLSQARSSGDVGLWSGKLVFPTYCLPKLRAWSFGSLPSSGFKLQAWTRQAALELDCSLVILYSIDPSKTRRVYQQFDCILTHKLASGMWHGQMTGRVDEWYVILLKGRVVRQKNRHRCQRIGSVHRSMATVRYIGTEITTSSREKLWW